MKKFINAICLAAALAGGCSLDAISEPYASVRTISYEPYFFENSYILLDKLYNQGTTIFIDVDSVDGRAARYVAANTDDTVKVYNINRWNENEHQFQLFLSNVTLENQTEKIVPLRMSSKEASGALNLISEIIFIDGSKSETIPEKIFSWVTHLSENGVIAGDNWGYPDVEFAVVIAATDLGLTLTVNSNFWFLSKN